MEVVGVDFLINNFELDTIDSSSSICTGRKRLVNERFPLSLLKLECGIKCDKIIHMMTYDVLMTDE